MATGPAIVLTVDAARARLFRTEGYSLRGLANLHEVAALAHPEARVPESQRHSDSNPRSAVRGGGYQTFDDHREDHEHEERRRFAKMIAVAIYDAVRGPCAGIVCVTHSMHSALQEALSRHCPKLSVTWYPRECTLVTPHELAEVLTEKGLLPQGTADVQMMGQGR